MKRRIESIANEPDDANLRERAFAGDSQVTLYCHDMRKASLLISVVVIVLSAIAVSSQTPSPTPLSPDKQAKRDATREKLGTLLGNLPKGIPITFKQAKNPYNYVGFYQGADLKNADSFEVVVGVSADETIGFRIYPHFNGAYINVDKARNAAALMRKMLSMNDHNFLFWGADDTGDVFAGYTFTLESGFPDEAIRVVLWSVAPLDQYVAQMRPSIDGTSGR